MSKLTPKRALFVIEYLVDFNATQAAIRAGYSKKTAGQIGEEILKKPEIKSAIATAMGDRMKRIEIDATWLLKRLVEEAEADIADLYYENGSLKPVHEWPKIWRQGLVSGVDVQQEYAYEEGNKVPDGVVTKLKLADRAKRLEMLGKHIDISAFATNVRHVDKDGEDIDFAAEGNEKELARRVAFLLTNGAKEATTH